MESINLVILGLGIGVLTLLLLLRNRDQIDRQKNHRGLFIMRITFLPVGVALFISTGNLGLLGISGVGAASLAMGCETETNDNLGL